MSITTSRMDLDTLFCKAHKLAPRNKTFIAELEEFEQFMEDNAYDIDALKNDSEQIRDGYLSQNHKNCRQALNVFNKITSILSSNNDNKLIKQKLYNKFNNFINSINFSIDKSHK
eukprot:730135_1